MGFLWNELNLINFLTFYCLMIFALSTWRRWRQYREMARFALSGPLRWPLLFKLVSEHRMIFLTWRTVAPMGLALGLALLQLLASQVLFPKATESDGGLTFAKLFEEPTVLKMIVITLGGAVVALDVYFLIVVGKIDRPLLEKYFDQAEYWLKSKMAHVVKIVTFGRINPRRMVAEEVRKALVDASNVVNTALWWVNLQMSLRFSFGLSLWIAWAVS